MRDNLRPVRIEPAKNSISSSNPAIHTFGDDGTERKYLTSRNRDMAIIGQNKPFLSCW